MDYPNLDVSVCTHPVDVVDKSHLVGIRSGDTYTN